MKKFIRSAVLCVCCIVLLFALLPLAGGFEGPAFDTVRGYAEAGYDVAEQYANAAYDHADEFLHTMKVIANLAIEEKRQEKETDQSGVDAQSALTDQSENEAAGATARQVTASFLLKDINIDGVSYDNYFLEKPILQAHGEYYFPATRELLKALGMRYLIIDEPAKQFAVGDVLHQPIKVSYREVQMLEKCMPSYESKLCEFVMDEGQAFEQSEELITNLRAYESLTEVEDALFVSCPSFGVPDMRNGWNRYLETVEPSGCEVIQAGGLFKTAGGEVYFSSEMLQNLGIDIWYDQISGLYVSTKDEVKADSLLNEDLQAQINSYADYILQFNKKISKEDAIAFEYYFRHEAKVTGLDEAVIMAVARTESNFREEAVGKGSLGMMQTLTRYAANYGYTEPMLKTAHYSIELGSKYLMDRMHMFGTEEKMLVAYNRGPASVRAGRTTSPYSEKVLKIKNEIENSLETNQS